MRTFRDQQAAADDAALLLKHRNKSAAVTITDTATGARILKEYRLRKAKAEKQIVSRGCARGSYERIARAYNRTCSDVQVGNIDIPAIFRIVRVAMALTPECSDEALDRMVAAAVESYSKKQAVMTVPRPSEY